MTPGRWMVLAAVVVLATIVAVVALAQQPSEPGMMGRGGMMGGQGMMGQGMGMTGMCPMHTGTMGAMMGRGALAVEGKYLYVLAGNKILKYDPNLKLVRQAEIKMDMAKMHQTMQEMMKDCPMHEKMMQSGGMMGGERQHMGGGHRRGTQ